MIIRVDFTPKKLNKPIDETTESITNRTPDKPRST